LASPGRVAEPDGGGVGEREQSRGQYGEGHHQLDQRHASLVSETAPANPHLAEASHPVPILDRHPLYVHMFGTSCRRLEFAARAQARDLAGTPRPAAFPGRRPDTLPVPQAHHPGVTTQPEAWIAPNPSMFPRIVPPPGRIRRHAERFAGLLRRADDRGLPARARRLSPPPRYRAPRGGPPKRAFGANTGCVKPPCSWRPPSTTHLAAVIALRAFERTALSIARRLAGAPEDRRTLAFR